MRTPILTAFLLSSSLLMTRVYTEPTGGVWRVGSIIILGSWFRLPEPAYEALNFFPNTNRGVIFAYGWAQICREHVRAAAISLVDPWPNMDNYTVSATYSSDLKQGNKDFQIFSYFDMEFEDIAIRVLPSVFWPAAEKLGLTVDRDTKTGIWEGADKVINNMTDGRPLFPGPCTLRDIAVESFIVPGIVIPYFGDRMWC